MSKVKITWYGHSCFKIEADGHSVVIDPYYSGVPGYPELKVFAGQQFASHDHDDHNYFQGVTLVEEKGVSPFLVRTVDSYHDEVEGGKRGKNKIHVFEVNGLKIAHFGDLGHILTKKQVAEIGPLHAAMIPVGGFYTIDGSQAKAVVEEIDPLVTIPMHYRKGNCGFDVITEVNAFTNLIEDRPVIEHKGNSIEIDGTEEKQVAVLVYPR